MDHTDTLKGLSALITTLEAKVRDLETKASDERMITPYTAAEVLHVSPEFVRNEIRADRLQASKIGGWRISRGALRAYVKQYQNF